MNKNKIFDNLLPAMWGLWGGFGAYRGHMYYNNDIKKQIEDYNKNYNYYKNNQIERERPKHYYFSNIWWMSVFGIFYAIPPFCLVGISHELYNLEDYFRKRDNKD